MNDFLMAAGRQWAGRAAELLQKHPKHAVAVVAAFLLCGGGGAYAVASLGPDAAALPVVQRTHDVEPLPLAAQVEALDLHTFNLFRSESLRPTDTADTLLGRLGIHDPAAAAFLRAEPAFRTQVLGRPGRSVTAEATDHHALVRLTARWAAEDPQQFRRLVIERNAEGRFVSRVETAPLVASLRMGGGLLRSSLFAAADEAGIPDAATVQLVEIFSGDIDFNRGLRRGDRFSVVYETLEADGEPLRTGRVISAEFVNNGRTHNAMWFTPPDRSAGYFSLDGQSLERSYLASPMEFSRVTSGFAMRMHPIHQTWRAHLGVDYGAPTGTPVRSIGEGRVDFAGWMGGYGNTVIVDHGKGETTLYAHLSRIDVRQGTPVSRGQRVGAVGATGWATGPHLHFEFRENGVHKDPLVVARRSSGVEITAQARPAFEQAARLMRQQLAAAAPGAQIASAQ